MQTYPTSHLVRTNTGYHKICVCSNTSFINTHSITHTNPWVNYTDAAVLLPHQKYTLLQLTHSRDSHFCFGKLVPLGQLQSAKQTRVANWDPELNK